MRLAAFFLNCALLCCCLFGLNDLNGQNRSAYERRWAVQHPFAAIEVKAIDKKCDRIYEQKQIKEALDGFSSGGKLDAFRHVFYMAAFAQKIKVHKLRQLGLAHEKANYQDFKEKRNEFGETPDSLSSVMDLHNNELGFRIGAANKGLSLSALSDLVLLAIKNGEAIIMKRNRKGTYLDCNNKELQLDKFVGKWFVPKCLVSSDFNYPN
jgi:hypothetical protein